MSDLGTARGRIIIDTSDVRRAQNDVQSASRAMTQSLQALGLTLGARKIADFVVESDRLATSYRRQSVAAVQLAGSQGQLNELLATYDEATGGALDKASQLAKVTKLMAVGFADSTEELDQFATAIRGISVAMGVTQDFATQNLILELFSQRGMRLDQLGLQYDKVRQRSEALQAADANLTKQAAYQQAVLEQAIERYGSLADSAEGAATGLELLGKAWENLKLAFGGGASGGTNLLFKTWASDLNRAADELRIFFDWLNKVNEASHRFRFNVGLSNYPGGASGSGISDRTRGNRPPAGGGPTVTPQFNEDQRQVIRQNADAVAAIERQANEDRLDATRQYEEQRTSTIRQYELTIAREAEDFGRNRLRSEQDFQRSIERMLRDSASRAQRAAEDLARTLGEALADSGERIADLREDANERLVELEEDYARNRERALADHEDKLLSAAGRLDAIAILEERKRFARQSRDAKDNLDEQREETQEQLAERIEDEREAHEDRRRQAIDAYERQLEDARAADEQRLEDMQADFDLRRERELEDRDVRLGRMAEDHRLQLDEMDRQLELDLQQIRDDEARKREEQEEQFNLALNEAQIGNDAWIAENNRITDAAVADYTRATQAAAANAAWLAQIAQGGGVSFPSLANPGVNLVRPIPAPATNTPTGGWGNRTVTINIYGDGLNETEVAEKVVELLEQMEPR